ncbi:putative deacetylase LmbE-like domain-containing protein [Dunaliella salina]|uniref:N-acetylglucosaminylphosphatidylinositol deacetylase n=1 Tax=Dunaliella salina TaxID=3046 RepID=A0ABQ7G2U6_DUNSA|nr:putative deacetylase LmbE-like domain-containing protein [Dunaliella salina]|eukprot:KAF5828924.1 putative deacetylase LmbE-like domain-containing protein [Dunaliella salina]
MAAVAAAAVVAVLVSLAAVLASWLIGWLYRPGSPSLQPLLSPTDRVLLVIAHPDDESMFFAPTVLSLREAHIPVFILCLSTGNADGHGSTRQRELLQACKKLNVPKENVEVIDDPQLQDGLKTVWPEQVIQKQVHLCAVNNNVNKVITFDEKGISSHPNHISAFHGVRAYYAWRSRVSSVQNDAVISSLPPLTVFTLETTSLVRKYMGFLDVFASRVYAQRSRMCLLVVNPQPSKGMLAMMQHRSQLVWYRWLFIVLSRYTYMNTLKTNE